MTQPSIVVESPRSSCIAGSAMATIVASRTTMNWARQSSATTMGSGVPSPLLPSNTLMSETHVPRPPTAATMRLDGGHPALDFVNTIYGQVGGPVEADVLAAPADLVTFARRVGLAGPETTAAPAALADARALRTDVDALLRAHVAGAPPPPRPARRPRGTPRAARSVPPGSRGRTVRWRGPGRPATRTRPYTASRIAALELLGDPAELARLHQCAGCCWLFLDHSRGAGRRWCSMADCGTEAKKRRYVERRRERRRRG